MRNDLQKPQGRNGGFFSIRSLSSYLRIVSSGASTVASSVKSAGASVASSIAERDDDAGRDQVFWAGFDKVESEGGVFRQVLLLGYRSGFQVWDVEEADDVRQLVSRHDGLVSFLQVQKKPVASKTSVDKFADVRPLLVVAGDVSLSSNSNNIDGACNGTAGSCQDLDTENSLPIFVHFYSLRTHNYVHVLKFRTAVYSVRCSSRIVAISQASQVHCFNAGTLEREYTILTCPIVPGCPGSGGIGYGPLAVGPRWLAYSGNAVVVSNTSRVSPQHLTLSTGSSQSPSNGSLVAHYAKESSKQLASGIVTLGDIGYKKLSKYCSELITDSNGTMKQENSSFKANSINGYMPDSDNIGMVIVRDIVLKSVVVQFRAHRSPISALCFDPSGTLLVTASINGHNINVFRIMPSPRGCSPGSDATGTSIHLYRLQRGITNAVIQDISFSDDSQWIMISSSRGTSHLYTIPPSGGSASVQYVDVTAPTTLSVVGRIKNGNGWKGAVTGAAAAATGRVGPLSGAIASAFLNCKGSSYYPDISSLRTKYYLLVFSPSGCIIQYMLRQSTGEDSGTDLSGLRAVSSGLPQESDPGFIVEALQKWDICHRRNRRDRVDCVDVYGEHGNGESTKHFQKGIKKGTSVYPTRSGSDTKVKPSPEENHHMYISEVELQMHSAQIPIWMKSEIYFQVLMDKSIIGENSDGTGGEIEIERIPTRTIEARSKELIPVFDYLQSPRFQQSRTNHSDYARNGLLGRQKSGLPEDGKLSRRSSCRSLDRMSESAPTTELPSGINETCWGTFNPSTEESEEFVYNSKEISKDQLEFVHNREGLKTEAQLECVNSKETLKMEAHFEDNDNDVD
ncbi:autophagy-related protein 18f-like isoform X1 [Iris pallida]|uniref:Autophagy-related protein 18f-like isoform X1 n=1 Tax=Iris pallida TaxID=29817 RepID=A0AAX6HPZ5_IRIPA|nr:autophagy-related protein 18f-like isoform X1 [Iris pallida]